VKYSEGCPDPGTTANHSGNKTFQMSLDGIPKDGLRDSIEIIKFVNPKHKK